MSHPSYSPMFNAENTPTEFGYVGGYPGRPPVDTGFTGQESTPRYSDDDSGDSDDDSDE
jgi:hypothetical protein